MKKSLLLGLFLVLGMVLVVDWASTAEPTAMLLYQLTDFTEIWDTQYHFPTAISGDGQKVAFSRQKTVYLGSSDGSDAPQPIGVGDLVFINYDGSKVLSADRTVNSYIRLYINGAEITPCKSDPRIGEETICLFPYEGWYNTALSGDGRYAFFVSRGKWGCEPRQIDGGGWYWNCAYPEGVFRVWRLPTNGGAPELWQDALNIHFSADGNIQTNHTGSMAIWAGRTYDTMVPEVYVGYGANQQNRIFVGEYIAYTNFKTILSPDGQWVAHAFYDRVCSADQHHEMHIFRSDGTDYTILDPLPFPAVTSYIPMAFSEDGATLLFESDTTCQTSSYRAFLVKRDGSALTPLLANSEFESRASSLSYDGLNIAFTSASDLLGNGNTFEQAFVLKGGVTKLAPLEAEIGSRMTYTITLRHAESGDLPASLLDPLPPNTLYVPGSVEATQGTATYDAGQRQITWDDTIAAGETVTITFAITPTCTAAPPPPELLHNHIIATLGTETLHPLAITVLTLPEKDLITQSDAPANGATDVLIESGGNGPRLQWHDQAAGMTCGASESADVAYRVYLRQQGGGWREVGTYPNCASQVQLSPADLACRENGDPATYQWKVAAHDPQFVCRQPVESVFGFTTASCRPEIEVAPEYTLTPGYFLDRTDLPNHIKVTVDWNGPAYATPVSAAPYGAVFFELNSQQVEKPGLNWGAEHVYDMGADFDAAFACANNTLNIWATHPVAGGGEYASLKTTLQPTVFPFPGWVEWVITNIPGSDASFKTASRAPLVAYTYAFNYPEPAFEATWTPPGWIPYLGGNKLGIQETQTAASVAAQSDGAGSARVGGQTGLDLGALTAAGTLWGQGDACFVCGESLDLERAEMGFSISAAVEKEAGLVDVIPAVKAAENWPVVGRIIRWVNSIATLKATFTPGVEVNTEFVAQDGQLVYNSGQGTASLDARATLGVEACDGLSAEAYGGGTPYVTIQVPKNPDYLKGVGIDMYYGAAFEAWSFEADYERKINCNYPGGCAEVDAAVLLTVEAGPVWRLIARDYAGPDYGHVTTPLPAGPEEAVADDEETILIPNAYVRSEPALAVREDDFRLLAYVHDDVAKPQGRGTEIRVLTWDGAWSSAPFTLTGDDQPDYAPAVAFDGDGNGLVIWERSALPAGITPALNITFAQSLEIAARPWISATASWGDMITLTNNTLMDRAPRLATGFDGTVLALWETTNGSDALGTSAHPLTYTYALWDGGAWSAPAAALTGLQDVLAADVAVHSERQAALVYVQDMDGVISTTTDAELYYSLFDGSAWSAPVRLTDDAVMDAAPSLAYDAAGRLHLAWLHAGDLVALSDSWDIADVETVRADSAESGTLGFTLSRSPGGHLALVWQAMGEQGADLVYTVRDVEAGLWGAAQPLLEDADVERAHSLAFADDGALYLAYQKVETEFVTRTFEISPTQTFTVTNLAQPGNSQLAFLAHSVGRDLTFDSLTVTPSNSAAGEGITLTAILRNTGALAVANPVVRFYDGGDSFITRTLPLTLTAGYTTTISVNWTVPVPPTAHTLRAVADPADLVAETDETNNAIALQTTLPDLAFATLYTTYASDAVTATARLANTGVVTASAPFSVTFRAVDPVTGTLVGQVAVTAELPAGETVSVTVVLTDTAALAGLGNTLWAVVDEDGRVVEAEEDNNTAYARLPVRPDLTLTAADIQGYDPVSVTVHNRGPVAAPTSVLQVWSGGLTRTLAYSATLAALTPGANQTITFTSAFTATEVWAYIDPDQSIAESNEGNNLAVRFVEAPSVPTHTLTIHIAGQGSVTQEPPGTAILPLQSSYFSGTHVTLSATPALGWAFVHWTGDLQSTANPAQITMDADKVITATFVAAHKVYLPVVLRNAP
ncbi:MAG: DUF11 domain-containing protein [Anaerolineae bacterium]|nr:DUF11 domain-containing protein [Anaerolineae bacterium]